MKIFGTFIGINKYCSADINNLTGAARDAQALWSLFADTFTDIDYKLLIDEDASHIAIQNAISETLEKPGTEDIAIISFSGHGTRNHRLVAYDTINDNKLEPTSISMEFLAEKFRKSKAQVIICILDCCFSGGAPAKVFSDTPVVRDIYDPFQELKGKGRILIAASSATQPAYEKPGTGHGLLTEAVLKILQGKTQKVNVTTAIYEIISIVQVEAARIGVIQTPVVLSLIEGDLVLPSLCPGEKYFSLFPLENNVTISSELNDLNKFGIPEIIIQKWQQKFQHGLNNLQLQAINNYKILTGKSVLVVAPTSSGKTFIGEMAAVKAMCTERKAIFLLPYRALVNEKYQEFVSVYSSQIGLKVIRCTGDFSDQAASFLRGKYDLALLTFEMFLNFIVSTPHILNHIGLIVLDEAQFITDPNRGINVELLLTCLLSARQRGISPQLIALSAVIGDVNKFDAWLGLDLLLFNNRPVPLLEGVIDRSGVYQYIDENGNIKESQLIPAHTIKQRKERPSAQDLIVPLVSQLVSNGEKVLIFRNQRGNAQGCANYLASELRLPPANEIIQRLPHSDQSSTSLLLRNCLFNGIAFHTSNLSREEREIIENNFRQTFGPIKVLVATTTVAAGINTPASTVIIAEHEFIGEDGRIFTVAEYKNMAGRAGRFGFTEIGKSIVVAENSIQRAQLFQKYVLGKVENMTSSFDPNNLSTWIIRLFVQVKSVPKKDIITLLVNTYGGYLATLSNSSWPQEMEKDISVLVERMISLGLLEQEGEQIQLTILGRACGNSSLSFESSLRLVEIIRTFSSWQLSKTILLALIQILQESDETYTPLFRSRNGEPKAIQQAIARYGHQTVYSLQKFSGGDIYTYQARCKRASVLFDWIHGISLEIIETEFSLNHYVGIKAGDIRRFADNARFHLRSAFQIAMVIAPQSLCNEQEFDALLQQLEIGIPESALELLQTPLPLNRGEYLTLLANQVHNLQELWALPAEKLTQVFGVIRAEQINTLRPFKTEESLPFIT